ncbi:tetratricopeptide repeat protein [Thermogemmatispora sp.]|uniref:tetratricopeptide repeat protein n=1 Tax=Thermogemmatispora sp. TaxID=1968838 RepID=UPI001DDA3013|nr:tetratricopeptide repeat protein [Thermogemmatispora sp.]MBX5450943.1 tetratricopeptide repeat protein [Thermogemmatispora sp.]
MSQQKMGEHAHTGDSGHEQAAFWLSYARELWGAIRYPEALAAVERALALAPDDPSAWYLRGACLCLLARHEEALASFEEALRRDKHYVPAWDGKAWALGILGRRSEALAAVEEALRLDPHYLQARLRKARLEATAETEAD